MRRSRIPRSHLIRNRMRRNRIPRKYIQFLWLYGSLISINKKKTDYKLRGKSFVFYVYFSKEVWIIDPATDMYYQWLTIVAVPAFYNLMLLVPRCVLF